MEIRAVTLTSSKGLLNRVTHCCTRFTPESAIRGMFYVLVKFACLLYRKYKLRLMINLITQRCLYLRTEWYATRLSYRMTIQQWYTHFKIKITPFNTFQWTRPGKSACPCRTTYLKFVWNLLFSSKRYW